MSLRLVLAAVLLGLVCIAVVPVTADQSCGPTGCSAITCSSDQAEAGTCNVGTRTFQTFSVGEVVADDAGAGFVFNFPDHTAYPNTKAYNGWKESSASTWFGDMAFRVWGFNQRPGIGVANDATINQFTNQASFTLNTEGVCHGGADAGSACVIANGITDCAAPGICGPSTTSGVAAPKLEVNRTIGLPVYVVDIDTRAAGTCRVLTATSCTADSDCVDPCSGATNCTENTDRACSTNADCIQSGEDKCIFFQPGEIVVCGADPDAAGTASDPKLGARGMVFGRCSNGGFACIVDADCDSPQYGTATERCDADLSATTQLEVWGWNYGYDGSTTTPQKFSDLDNTDTCFGLTSLATANVTSTPDLLGSGQQTWKYQVNTLGSRKTGGLTLYRYSPQYAGNNRNTVTLSRDYFSVGENGDTRGDLIKLYTDGHIQHDFYFETEAANGLWDGGTSNIGYDLRSFWESSQNDYDFNNPISMNVAMTYTSGATGQEISGKVQQISLTLIDTVAEMELFDIELLRFNLALGSGSNISQPTNDELRYINFRSPTGSNSLGGFIGLDVQNMSARITPNDDSAIGMKVASQAAWASLKGQLVIGWFGNTATGFGWDTGHWQFGGGNTGVGDHLYMDHTNDLLRLTDNNEPANNLSGESFVLTPSETIMGPLFSSTASGDSFDSGNQVCAAARLVCTANSVRLYSDVTAGVACTTDNGTAPFMVQCTDPNVAE